MATKDLSNVGAMPAVRQDWHLTIVKAEWNVEITDKLLAGAMTLLSQAGVPEKNIRVLNVPGSFELPLGAQWALEHHHSDAVICLGAVIRGETPHFDYVCQAVSAGIKDVALKFNKPVIFGVLTDDTPQQSHDRSGGKHGNKGTEAAATALKMLALISDL